MNAVYKLTPKARHGRGCASCGNSYAVILLQSPSSRNRLVRTVQKAKSWGPANGIAQGRAAGGLQRLLATRWRRNCPVGIALCTRARSFAGYVGTPCDGAVWLQRPRPGQSKISREAERAARAWGAGESASRGIKTVELSCIVTFGRESQTFAAHIQSKRMRQARYLPHPGHAKL
jgi:hypothetical protein